MKITATIVMLGLAAIALFPPTDYVYPPESAFSYSGERINGGFKFISEVGGQLEIRYMQWFTEIGIGVVIGGIAIFAFGRKS